MLRRKQRETDLARRERDVGVGDARAKADGRWREGIVGGDGYC